MVVLLLLAAMAAGCGGASPKQRAAADSQQTVQQEPGKPAAGQAQPDPTPRPVPGSPAPEVTAVNVFNGAKIKLSELRGKPVMLNFWATWCGPCRLEMPDMERLHKELGDQITIVAVGGDDREELPDLRAFATELGLTFTVAHDGGAGIRTYRAIGLPTTFFIDKDGIIREKVQGAMPYDFMRDMAAKTQAPGKQ
jgi:thiol-disulfide isomerase/thioredoxin